MWNQIERHLPEFNSAVLSAVDAAGRPASFRCRPTLDAKRQVLWIPAPPQDLALRPGPACLLCHRHDERLWNLKSFVARGQLAPERDGWTFTPEKFIPGMGIGGLWGYVRFVLTGRRTTRRYLAARGLPRPQVPWDDWGMILEGRPQKTGGQ